MNPPNVPDLIRPDLDPTVFSQEPATLAPEGHGSDRHGSRDLHARAEPFGGLSQVSTDAATRSQEAPKRLRQSHTSARILKCAQEIQETRSERPSFLHSVLCQVGLPRSQTNRLIFERTNGRASLSIEARKLWDGTALVQQPLPYGMLPRLVLMLIFSEAVRAQSRVVNIGRSVRNTLMRLGLDTGAGNTLPSAGR